MRKLRPSLALTLILSWPALAQAAPAVVFQHPYFQSPVRGAPDDLVLLAGGGFAATDVVVYRRIFNTTAALVAPATVPGSSTPSLGVAPVVSATNVPDSLTVRLPGDLIPGAPYALWVKNAANQWSAGVLINDARPQWLSPGFVYASAPLSSLPRRLKVIGRNLERAAAATPTRVRLVGPATYTLTAADDLNPSTTIEHYVADVPLPATMSIGNYSVQVSRDGGTSWELTPQVFGVVSNPAALPSSSPSNFGCLPNDDLDDTRCVLDAILAVGAGGWVDLGPGTWDLNPDAWLWSTMKSLFPLVVSDEYGLTLPPGVGIRGAGVGATIVNKAATWPAYATLTAVGANTIRQITWKDLRTYGPKEWSGPLIQLGQRPWGIPLSVDAVSSVVIDNNVFARPFIAIGNEGLPVRNLIITDNEFGGAYFVALNLGGNQYVHDRKFRVDDTIIRDNRFSPGDYLDTCAGQGTMASSIGAGARLEISNNQVDGFDTSYLDDLAHPGWRAGFFFQQQGNFERVLVASNQLTCTGDKAGDGESIVFDSNLNTIGFKDPPTPVAVGADSVTVPGPLLSTHSGNGQPLPAGYFDQHWLQVANGPGLGQTRKILSITPSGSNLVFRVSPAWDVRPVPGASRVTVSRQHWQVNTVDNLVDQRGCTKNNQNGLKTAGVMSYYGMTSDSSFEGNRLYESAGFVMPSVFARYLDVPNYFLLMQSFSYFNEVRNNSIIDEVDYDSGCSLSGIQVWFGGTTGTTQPPDTLPSPVVTGYGLSIAHNQIVHADGLRGGAISFAETWWVPPGSKMWLNSLVHHNRIADLPNTPPTTTTVNQCSGTTVSCDVPARSICTNLRMDVVHDTVLYANSCPSGATPLLNLGSETTSL